MQMSTRKRRRCRYCVLYRIHGTELYINGKYTARAVLVPL
jgi:hypothetical protein